MYNPYVTSTISIRCKAPISYSFNECSYCPIDYRNNTHLISSSQSCCCVCCSANYVYTNVNPRFLCGSRQSSLIHWSASRRIRILPEPDPYCCRVNPVRDPCRKCCCGGGKERGFGERKFTRRVSNGRSFDLENTEMMLSLLIEEVGEECYGVREREIGSSRRVEFEKKRRESDGFRKKEEKKKRNLDSGILGSSSRSKYEAIKTESGKNEAINRRKEDTMNEDEEILRSENHRGRKSRTSFSSYYTCSSLGEESESESEFHDRNEAFEEELDVGFKIETEKIGNIVYEGEIKENSRKSENVVGSRKRMESDWRKKSEKKLDEVAIEEVLETSHQRFNNFDDNSKYSISDNKGKGQQYSRKSDQVVGVTELIKSQKQFTEISEDQVNVVTNSRKQFSGRDDKSAAAGSLVIGRKRENVKTDNRVSQKDDYKFSDERVNQVSQIEDINVKRANILHSRYEDREKRQEDRFSGVSSTGNQYYIKSEEDSKKMDSRRKFQHSAEISDDRVSRRDDYRSNTEQSNQVDQIQEIDVRKTNISQAQYKDNLKRREERISSSGVSSTVQDTGNKYYIKSEEDSRKMDSRRKFQHSAEISDGRVSRRDDVRSSTEQSNQVVQIQEMDLRKTNISQAQYEHNVKRREDKSSVISSSVQDTEHRYYMKSEEDLRQMDSRGKFSQSAEISDDRVSRRDDYVSSYQQSNQVSQIHDTNIRRTNISNAQYENKVKRREDQSSMISGSVQDTEYQYYLQGEEELRQINLRRKLQQSTEISAQGQDVQSSRQAIREKESAKGSIDTSIIMLGQSSDTQITNHKTSENKISNQETYSSMVTKSSEESKKITEKSDNRVLRIGSIKETGGTSHKASSTVSQSQTNNDNLISISDEDVLGSSHRFQKSSSKIVGEFLETVINEASSSHQQIEKSTSEEEMLLKSHTNEQKSSSEDGDVDFKSRGPSDEIWDEAGPSTREDANTQTQLSEIDSTNKNIIVKRTGRSLWNVISDIVRLPWSAKSKMSTPKSEKRNSPNQSTKSEAWFSSHDRDESSDENIKRNKSISRESIPTPSQTQGEEYSSSSSKDKISPSKTPIESTTPKNGSSSVSTEENFRNDGSIMMETSVSLPSLRIRRSPNVDNVEEFDKRTYQLETEGVSASGSLSGKEQVIVSSSINVKGSEDKVGVDMKRRMLQRTNQVIKDRFDEWEEAFTLETEQRKIDEAFMREALLEAKKAGDMWEVPVGAVLVHNGKIIARGYNLVEELRDSTAHAEMICIKEGSNQLRSWRLANTTLYVTLEPCPMCAGAILQARVDTVVWGAPNKLLGADGSWIRLFPDGNDGGTTSEPTDKPPAPVHPFHPKIVIRRGVLGTECADVMQEFFQLRRRKKKIPDTPPTPPSCLPISNHPTKVLTRMHDALHFMFCL